VVCGQEVFVRRVVITGLGPVTPIGVGNVAFHQAQLEGRSGVRAITHFDASGFAVRIAAEVDLDLGTHLEPREAKRFDRFTQLGLIAAKLALEDAGLEPEHLETSGFAPERVGVVFGSGIGGMSTWETQARIGFERGYDRLSPFTVPMLMVNAAAAQLSSRYGLCGPVTANATACMTGTDAIGQATRMIQHHEADMMLAGSAETLITPLALGAFSALRALSTRNHDPEHASRPFSRDRDGFVLAEGAAILVLEDFEHARSRGARIYAEITGFGRAGDAHHVTEPHPEGAGLARAIRNALRDAQIAPEQVHYVNAHATSTPLGDRAEVLAIRQAFGNHAGKLAISSTKSMIGHGLGAAGSIEAIASAQAVYHGVVPPTINLMEPDPEFDLDFVPHQPREARLECVISNSSAFGGLNAVLVFQKVER
jgi:3-oxoacyl-[acyl-carrier-protein] synthase II